MKAGLAGAGAGFGARFRAVVRSLIGSRIGRRLVRAAVGPAGASARELDLPRVPTHPRLAVPARVLGRRVGSRSTTLRGAGVEAEGVRPWTEGDPARAIDWRVTARMGEPFVRSWHDDRELPVHVVVDLGSAAGGLAERQLRRAAAWLLSVAVAADHPVGLVVRSATGLTVAPPARGRRALAARLGAVTAPRPDETPAEVSLAEAVRPTRGDGLVYLVSTFDYGPEPLADLEAEVARPGRRSRIVPVRIGAPPAELPRSGAIRVRMPGTGVAVVDTSDPTVRRAWADGRMRWLDALDRLESRTTRSIVLRLGDARLDGLVSAVLARGGHRATAARRRRTGAAAAAVLLALLPGTALGSTRAPADPPSAPAPPEVLLDRMESSAPLGGELRRELRLRWPGGPDGAPVATPGEAVDVRVISATPVPDAEHPGTLWRVEVGYRFWRLGEQSLPTVRIAGVPGAGDFVLRSRRVRVVPPTAPPGGLEPAIPVPRPGSSLAFLALLPAGLAIAGVGFVAHGARGALRGRNAVGEVLARQETVDPLPDPTGLSALVERVRTRLERRAGAHRGWSGRRWSRWAADHLEPADAGLVEVVTRRVDERRFRPGSPGPDEMAEARTLVAEFLRRSGEAPS